MKKLNNHKKSIAAFAALMVTLLALTACQNQANLENAPNEQNRNAQMDNTNQGGILGGRLGAQDGTAQNNTQNNEQVGFRNPLNRMNNNQGNIANQTSLPKGLYNAIAGSNGCSLALDDQNNTCTLSYVDDSGNVQTCSGPATVSGDKIVINDTNTGKQVTCNYNVQGNTCNLNINGKNYTCQKQ